MRRMIRTGIFLLIALYICPLFSFGDEATSPNIQNINKKLNDKQVVDPEVASADSTSNPSSLGPSSTSTTTTATQIAISKDHSGNKNNATINQSGPVPYLSASSVQVDPYTGSVSTSIPIVVPQGRAGIQPNLSLFYNTSLPNGIFGVGWNLELGAIQRSTKKGVPKYNSTDSFVFMQAGSNEELVYDGVGLYHPENEGAFMKIEFKNGSWLVTDRKGTKYTFGQDQSAQEFDPDDSSKVFKWFLNHVEDLHGNYMDITYSRFSNKLYPNKIYYTGNSKTGLPTYAIIQFDTESRTDFVQLFNGAFHIYIDQRIKRINTFINGVGVTSYELTYAEDSQSLSTNRSILTKVTQFGSDGSLTLPSTIFSYAHGAPDFGAGQPIDVHPEDHLDSELVRVMDMNSDGLPDWLVAKDHNYQIYFNKGNFSFEGDPTEAIHTPLVSGNALDVRFVDLNGDGLLDVIYGNGQGCPSTPYQVWINNGLNGYKLDYPVSFCPNHSVSYNNLTQFVDMNGDGFVDIVDAAANKYDVYLNDGTGNFGAPTKLYNSPTAGTDTPDTRFVDFNGDGLADVIYGSGGSCPGNLKIWINTGSGFEGPAMVTKCPDHSVSHQNLLSFVDMNADGLIDLVDVSGGNYRIYLNNGKNDFETSFTADHPPILSTSNSNVKWVDMNGDGLLDVLLSQVSSPINQYQVYINKGTDGFMPAQSLSNWPNAELDDENNVLVDLNGDNLPDLVRGDGAYKVYPNSVGNGVKARIDTINKIDNSVGGTTDIEYQSSLIEALQGYQYKIGYSPVLFNTVKKTTVSNSLGDSYETSYEYKGGAWNLKFREFRGFKFVKVIDPDGNYSQTEFWQDDILKGRPKEQASYDSLGSLFSKTVNKWTSQQILPGAGGDEPGSNFIYLERLDNYIFDGDSTGHRIAQQFFYGELPQYGNLTKTISLGEVDLVWGTDQVSSDNLTAETEYLNNTSNGQWLIGFPKHTSVKDSNGSLIRQGWIFYDGSNNFNQAPSIGLVTKKEDWNGDHQGGPKNPIMQYAYDPDYGNLLTATDPMGHLTTSTYDSTYHMFPLTTVNAMGYIAKKTYYGIEGVPLNDGEGYSGLWGQSKSSTDPNNQTVKTDYDTFGRPVATVGPLDTLAFPSSSMEYLLVDSYIAIKTHQRINHGQLPTIDAVQFYDGLGRAVQSKSLSETPGQYIVSGQVQYNSRGLPAKHYISRFTNLPLDTMDTLDESTAHSTIEYDAMGRVTKTKSPDESYSTVSYDDWTATTIDENGHMQKSYADVYGRVIKKEEYLGADGRSPNYVNEPYSLYAATQYVYDSAGNLLSVTDANNKTTSIQYDDLGRKVSMDDPDMGHWEYEYDLSGNLKHQIDAKGQILDFDYDVLNRLKSKANPLGIGTAVDYNYDDPLVNYSKGRLTKAQYQGTQNAQFVYDALGRETQSTKVIDQTSYTVGRAYDALSRLTSVQYPDMTGVYYAYNAAGQIEKVADGPIAAPPSYLSSAFVHYRLNDNSSSTAVVDTGTGQISGIASQATSTLSQSGKISSSFKFNGTSQYVKLDDLVANIKNDTKATISFWAKRGNLSSTLVSFGDSDGDRLFAIQKSTPDTLEFGTSGAAEMHWRVRASGILDSNNWIHITLVVDGVNQPKVYKNDQLFPVQELWSAPDYSKFLGSNYDVGRLGCDNYAGIGNNYFWDGQLDDFRYYKKALNADEVGALYNKGIGTEEENPVIGDPGNQGEVNEYVKNVNYNEHGQITKIEYGNGTATYYKYDDKTLRLESLKTFSSQVMPQLVSKLTTQVITEPWPINTADIQDFQYTYDSAGNILHIQDSAHTATQTFIYDALNRLRRATSSYGIKTYGYNKVGNIIVKDGLTYYYGENGAGPHAVTRLSDGTLFDYDANGNMKVKTDPDGTMTEYLYDTENRLVEVKKNTERIAQYEYDGDGGRTKRTVYQNSAISSQGSGVQGIGSSGGGIGFSTSPTPAVQFGNAPINGNVTRYIGSLYEISGEGTNQHQTRHIFLGGTRVASIIDGHIRYAHSDHLGGANLVTDETGAIKELIEYEPYGQFSKHEKYGSSEETALFYFTGKQLDDETGLYYYGARYYDPKLGRFITPDTIVQSPGNPQTLNRYTYCNNNPVNLIDPTGHSWWGSLFNAVGSFLKAAVQIVAYAVLSPIISPIGAGLLIGFVSGGLSGGGWSWEGALMGAAIGGISGGAFGSTGTNGFLGTMGKPIGYALMGAGAIQAGVTGGVDGLINFGASVAGGFAGAGAGSAIVKSQRYQNFLKGIQGGQVAASSAGANTPIGARGNTAQSSLTTNQGEDVTGNQALNKKGCTISVSSYDENGNLTGTTTGDSISVYRKGNLGVSNVKGGQWAPENPLTTPGYDQKYGLPLENTGRADFVVRGQTQSEYGLGPAPGSHNNPINTGGATEVKTNNVKLDSFYMPDHD